MSASIPLRAERLPIRHYTTADGLAHNTVNRIVKDSQGFLWFCTAGGLARFDGYSFRTLGREHGLPHSSVTDFLETRRGEFWVATKGGLVRFHPIGTTGGSASRAADGSLSSAMFVPVSSADPNPGSAQITALHEARDGTIWVGTNNGLYRLEQSGGGPSLTPVDVRIPNDFPEQREVTDVIEDRRGTLWVAAMSGLYRRWPDGSAARYTERDGLPSAMLSDLLEDRAGHLWAGTMNHGFFRFTAEMTHDPPAVDSVLDLPQGMPSSWVFRLFETSDGRFWAATANGIVEFIRSHEPNGRRLRWYGDKNGVTDFQVLSATEDPGGNLWFGTGNAGAMKLTQGGFITYGSPDGIRSIHAIFEDSAGQTCFRGIVLGDTFRTVFDGAVFDMSSTEAPVGHGRLGCFDGQRVNWFYPSAVGNFGWVGGKVTLRARSGEWWVGSGDGVYRYAPQPELGGLKTARPMAVYTVKDGLPGPQIFALFEDSRGNVWMSTTSGTTHGLARWDRATDRIRDLSHMRGLPSLKDDVPRDFAEDRSGSVWIGFNRGLARCNDAGVSFFTVRDGLPPGQVRDLHVDQRGRLWVASSQGGLVRVDNGATPVPTFVGYTAARGLSSDNTEVIGEDNDGHIFVGGGRGLDRVDPESGRVRHFTTADGLPPGLLLAAFRDRHGVLWFGTSLGLARLASVSSKSAAAPPILIDGLRVRGIPHAVSVLGEQDLTLAALSPQQNQMQIDFVGLSFVPGEALLYQYRLGDAHADWSALSNRRSVTYASLPPGRYRFEVRAVSSQGVASTLPAAVSFTVPPPFWLRWWFLASAGLAAAFGVHALYRYRLSRLLEMAEMRTRIATDLHDDIGANLTRIALLSEVARQTSPAGYGPRRPILPGPPDDDPIDGRLASIAQIARESVAAMSDIVWAINPRHETMLDLERRMRQHADELFTARDIELRFEASAAAHNSRVGLDVRRNLLLIFKEAVSNAAKHSHCSTVRIDLRREGPNLVLTVADNGVGFDPSLPGDGQGCPSMHRRASRLGGQLRLVSGKGLGTTVTLETPL